MSGQMSVARRIQRLGELARTADRIATDEGVPAYVVLVDGDPKLSVDPEDDRDAVYASYPGSK